MKVYKFIFDLRRNYFINNLISQNSHNKIKEIGNSHSKHINDRLYAIIDTISSTIHLLFIQYSKVKQFIETFTFDIFEEKPLLSLFGHPQNTGAGGYMDDFKIKNVKP